MASKESVLDDDASIYVKRTQKSEKQKWSELNKQEKKEYFRDYYLKKVLYGVFGLAIIIYFIYSTAVAKTTDILYVAVVNDYWDDDATDTLEDNIKNFLGSTAEKEVVTIDDSYYLSSADAYNYTTKLITYIAAKEVDMLVADKDQFLTFAEQEYFADLSEVLPSDLFEELADYIVYATYDDDGTTVTKAVGVDLSSSTLYTDVAASDNGIIGIVVNTEFLDNAVDTLRLFAEFME